ncbi:Thioredoxin domain protein [Desulforamulus reducens MI-1]|uniref:Thioredoxin domain protein n=1 Tax=Desulforamulus reducens (strain ATCC BAA-1160 / DSM 100696 / MI-1) TaxID=349161 RepID=A4J7X2_DESRM|nr:thioredoxin family protein [Desulforamulus reducens]ABO51175.1 Thioredoxin domain protein [Desulforamulus reducens MI-1]
MADILRALDPDNFDEVVYEADNPVVVMFGAERCHVCQEVKPGVESLAENYKDQAEFCWVDVDAHKSLLERFRLKGIPQVLFFNEGELNAKLGGLREEEELEEKLTELL